MSQLSEAIQEMRNMREAYDDLLNTSEVFSPELSAGKAAIAQAITDKGVTTPADATLADMAENIGDIQQCTVEVEDTAWYGQQIGAGGVLWDLYAVLAEMKNRFLGAGQYGALIVCEYYKGYDSLVLQGADAYYTCDGDLYDYASPTHVWHDNDNGKLNRWVCFLYQQEGARLDITNTAISPRSMYIGGHIGTIEYFVNGRLTQFVCGIEETDVVDYFLTREYTQEWGANCILNNVGAITDSYERGYTKFLCSATLNIVINFEHATHACEYLINATNAKYIEIKNLVDHAHSGNTWEFLTAYAAEVISIPDFTGVGNNDWFIRFGTNCKQINMPNLISAASRGSFDYTGSSNPAALNDIIVGAVETNLNIGIWNPTAVLSDPDKKAQLVDNIKNHILARVSDATGGTQLVFTVSTNMYNAIASETITWNDQTMTLADAFLTKNWLLAGA